MLTETELHYLVGFLYLNTLRTDISIVLGEKVYDEAAEKGRDIDIVIATVGGTGMIGVEVKDEGRPLDVGKVEQLCLKFIDMPEISSRFIVSGSGFAAPAIKKAKKHDVACLRLLRGPIPKLGGIDMTALRDFNLITRRWIAPRVTFLALQGVIPPESEWRSVMARLTTGQRIPATDLAEWLVSESFRLGKFDADLPPGEQSVVLSITDSPVLEFLSGPVAIHQARVFGTLCHEHASLPLDSVHILDTEGTPFAGAVLVDIKGALVGISAAAESSTIQTFVLPEKLRSIRPVRHRL